MVSYIRKINKIILLLIILGMLFLAGNVVAQNTKTVSNTEFSIIRWPGKDSLQISKLNAKLRDIKDLNLLKLALLKEPDFNRVFVLILKKNGNSYKPLLFPPVAEKQTGQDSISTKGKGRLPTSLNSITQFSTYFSQKLLLLDTIRIQAYVDFDGKMIGKYFLESPCLGARKNLLYKNGELIITKRDIESCGTAIIPVNFYGDVTDNIVLAEGFIVPAHSEFITSIVAANKYLSNQSSLNKEGKIEALLNWVNQYGAISSDELIYWLNKNR